jgi:hypothetical protein
MQPNGADATKPKTSCRTVFSAIDLIINTSATI